MRTKEQIEILEQLSKYVPVPKDVEEIILKYSSIKKIEKGTIVLKEGQVSSECYFILNGCFKKYFLKDGKEKITGFYTEGHVVTPTSYTDRLPSAYYLYCMEDTFVMFGDPASEDEMYKKYPELEAYTRAVTEKLIVNQSTEFDNWLIRTPEERYLLLLNERPDLLQRIPQYQIANYLGVEPESLSRIKKRLIS